MTENSRPLCFMPNTLFPEHSSTWVIKTAIIIKKYWHLALTEHWGGARHLWGTDLLSGTLLNPHISPRHLSWGMCDLLRVSPQVVRWGCDPTGGIQQVSDQINRPMQTAETHNLHMWFSKLTISCVCISCIFKSFKDYILELDNGLSAIWLFKNRHELLIVHFLTFKGNPVHLQCSWDNDICYTSGAEGSKLHVNAFSDFTLKPSTSSPPPPPQN